MPRPVVRSARATRAPHRQRRSAPAETRHYRRCGIRRQGPKGTRRSADQANRGSPPNMARRTWRTPHRPDLPEPSWRAAQPRRRRTPPDTPRHQRRTALPVAAHKDALTPRAAPHRRHAATRRRRRHFRDRPMARRRRDRDNPDLPARETSRSKKGPSPAPRHLIPSRDATDHPMPCSPSSRHSDYADLVTPSHTNRPGQTRAATPTVGITRRAA
jgi:hypothetical protein